MAVVWRAKPGEADAVAGLLVEFRDWWGRDTPADASFEAGVRRLIEDRDTEYLLGAVHEDVEPSGVCQLRFRYGVWHAAEDCWLEDLYVREQARGSGLGRALAEAAIARALQRRCARVQLDVDETNAAAVALYEGLGFGSGSGEPGGRKLLMSRPVAP